jgi:hypothetical protein
LSSIVNGDVRDSEDLLEFVCEVDERLALLGFGDLFGEDVVVLLGEGMGVLAVTHLILIFNATGSLITTVLKGLAEGSFSFFEPGVAPEFVVEGEDLLFALSCEPQTFHNFMLEVAESGDLSSIDIGQRLAGEGSGIDHEGSLFEFHHVGGNSEGSY